MLTQSAVGPLTLHCMGAGPTISLAGLCPGTAVGGHRPTRRPAHSLPGLAIRYLCPTALLARPGEDVSDHFPSRAFEDEVKSREEKSYLTQAMSADAPNKASPAAFAATASPQGLDDARANQTPAGESDEGQLEKPRNHLEPGFFSRRRMLGPVEKDYGDYGLLACSLVTGMVDGASFLNWGVFVGMQTGEF